MKRRQLIKNENGAAAVEFAILLPLLVLLLAGIIEYGLVMFNQQMITNASREAARAGIVQQTPRLAFTGTDSVEQIALDYCQDFLVTFDSVNPLPTVTSNLPDGSQEFGDRLTVIVQYNYQFLFLPNIQSLFGDSGSNTLTMQATTTMRYE